MKSIVFRGPVLSQCGYGVHARQLIRWLFDLLDRRHNIELYIEPVSWGNTPWITDPEAYNGLIGRIIQYVRQKESYDISIQLQLPNEWNPFLANYNIGMTAGVETDRCNPEWVSAVNRMDLVIVPSEFAKKVFTNTSEVITKIEVIPECYIDETANENIEPLKLLNLESSFNFLIFGQLTGNNPENDRKNIFYTVKWLAELFKDEPDIGVIIKTNSSRNTVVDKIITLNIFNKLLAEVQKGPGPKFYLLHGDMTNHEVAALYRHPSIKALVTLTRGECFGLPILEAAVSKLPIIATDWSAYTEFLDKGKFIKIDYKLGPIHESRIDNQIFVSGANWAHPDEIDAKKKIRKFVEKPTLPMQWANDLSKILKEEYSYDAIAKHYDNVIGRLI